MHSLMLRTPARSAFAISFMLGALLLSTSCADDKSDDDAIRELVLGGAKAIEKNAIGELGDLLSETYRDDAKRDKKKVKRLVFAVRRMGPVALFVRDFVIDVDAQASLVSEGNAPNATKATVAVDVFAVQGKAKMKTASDLIPKRARKHEIKIECIKEGGKWRVTSIAGDRLGMEGVVF